MGFRLSDGRRSRFCVSLSRARSGEMGSTYQAVKNWKTLHLQVHASIFKIHIRRALPGLSVLL